MATKTLTADDEKLIVAIFKQLNVSEFKLDYEKLADELGIEDNGKRKGLMAKRWQRLKAKLSDLTGEKMGVKANGSGEDEKADGLDEVVGKSPAKKRKFAEDAVEKKKVAVNSGRKVTARKGQVKKEETDEDDVEENEA